jgi:glycosyltransferase involved in cell wall biosynthesis
VGEQTVSIVMPTYNRRALLERVLWPLLEDPAATEIVVVVDGSQDGSYELLGELAEKHPQLRPLKIENRGKEGARQAGLDVATGEVVLIMDDDVLAEPGLVSGHAAAHAGEDGLVVVGYMPVDPPEPRRAGDAPTLLYAAEYERRCEQYEVDPSLVLKTLWGGNISMSREHALRVGLVSDFSQGYHQDRDFGLRCAKAGLRGRFDRSLAARHLHERSLDAFIRDARRQGAGRRQIHELHPELLPALEPDEFAKDLPAPARALVLACRRPRLAGPVSAALKATAGLAGRLRLWPLETAALKLTRRMEQQRGALLGA